MGEAGFLPLFDGAEKIAPAPVLFHLFQPREVRVRKPRPILQAQLGRHPLQSAIQQRRHGVVGQGAILVGLFRDEIEVLQHSVVERIEEEQVSPFLDEVLSKLLR